MTRDDEMNALLCRLGHSNVSDSAYDTGWVARLGDVEPALAAAALDWLRGHQSTDGTWGALDSVNPHDRVLCTLSAAVALTLHGSGVDHQLVRRAAPALSSWLALVKRNTASETAGFGLLAPALLCHARDLKIVGDEADDVLARLTAERAQQLAQVASAQVGRHSPFAEYAEFATGADLHLLALDDLVLPDGSVGSSPAATAFHVSVTGGCEQSLTYLRRLAGPDGGIPAAGPAEVFEAASSLRNLGLTRLGTSRTSEHHLRAIADLERSWTEGHGVGSDTRSAATDGATTATAYAVLSRSNAAIGLATLFAHTGSDRLTYSHRDPVTWPSTGVRLLEALRAAGLSRSHPAVGKVVEHLAGCQHNTGYWLDRRHLSPFSVTAHAVVAGSGYPDEVFGRAVRWLLDNQRADGSWGVQAPTAEETAYCLQALVLARRRGHPVPAQVVRDGHGWLHYTIRQPHPALWIGKSLYAPGTVIDSAVISALALAEEDNLVGIGTPLPGARW